VDEVFLELQVRENDLRDLARTVGDDGQASLVSVSGGLEELNAAIEHVV